MSNSTKVTPVERVASYFRKPLTYRFEMCLQLLAPFIKGKDMLELGCGSGYFSFKLFEKSSPRSITCIDISHEAIKRANKIAKELYGNNHIFNFITHDITTINPPSSHITVGLGLLDYLTKDEIADLFLRIKSNNFLFTFSEKSAFLFRLLHVIYLKYQQCPKHYYYSKSEIRECCGMRFPDLHFINHPKLSFGCIVHNLPTTNVF